MRAKCEIFRKILRDSRSNHFFCSSGDKTRSARDDFTTKPPYVGRLRRPSSQPNHSRVAARRNSRPAHARARARQSDTSRDKTGSPRDDSTNKTSLRREVAGRADATTSFRDKTSLPVIVDKSTVDRPIESESEQFALAPASSAMAHVSDSTTTRHICETPPHSTIVGRTRVD